MRSARLKAGRFVHLSSAQHVALAFFYIRPMFLWDLDVQLVSYSTGKVATGRVPRPRRYLLS
jgi:hypothetical protein